MTRPGARAIAACLLIGLLASACGNSTSTSTPTTAASTTPPKQGQGGEAKRDVFVERPGVPGVTDDAIKYTVIGTKTNNPLGICILDCYLDGVKAYFAYRNSQGGIYGRKLEVGEVVDDELSSNQQKALDVISGKDAFGVLEATLLATGWGDLDQAGVPTYVWGIDSQNAANRPHIFPSLAVRCDLCPRPSVPYVAFKAGATRAASVGYGVSENSKQCTKAVAKAFDLYEDDSKVELAYTNDDLDYGLPNGIGPEVTAMKKAGVDFISTCIDLNGMKTLAQELHRQGMDDVTLYHPNSYDQGAIRQAGDLFEGDVVSVQFRPFEDDAKDTAMADFQHWMRKQGSEPSELAMTGWLNASMAYDGLLAAGPEFDQQAATDGLNAQTAYTAGGLLEPIDWTKAHTPYSPDKPEPEPRSCAAFVKVHQGKLVPYDDPAKPWLCWKAGKKVPFTPTPTDFS